MKKSIQELVDECHLNSKNHGWWDNPEDFSVPLKLCLIHSEISEALEEFRVTGPEWKPLREITFDEKGKPLGFAIELVDTIIRIFDLAGAMRINLEEALEAKMAYNVTRPHRHGGKSC